MCMCVCVWACVCECVCVYLPEEQCWGLLPPCLLLQEQLDAEGLQSEQTLQGGVDIAGLSEVRQPEREENKPESHTQMPAKTTTYTLTHKYTDQTFSGFRDSLLGSDLCNGTWASATKTKMKWTLWTRSLRYLYDFFSPSHTQFKFLYRRYDKWAPSVLSETLISVSSTMFYYTMNLF